MNEEQILDQSVSISNSLSDLPKSLKEKISYDEIDCFTLEPFNYLEISPSLSAKSNHRNLVLTINPLEKIQEVESKYEISTSQVDKSQSSTNFLNNRLSKISLNSNDLRNSTSNLLASQEGFLNNQAKNPKTITLTLEEIQEQEQPHSIPQVPLVFNRQNLLSFHFNKENLMKNESAKVKSPKNKHQKLGNQSNFKKKKGEVLMLVSKEDK